MATEHTRPGAAGSHRRAHLLLERAARLSPRRTLSILLALTLAIEALFFALGVRPDKSLYDLTAYWQVLDRYYLQHDLWQSLWQLHVQPPLFNLLAGLYVVLPKGAVEVVMVAVNSALGVILVGSLFELALELGLSVAAAGLLSLFVACSPSFVLYESWEFYTFPTAALCCLSAAAAARWFRTRRLRCGVVGFAAAAGVVLVNSTFQWPYLVGLIGCALFFFGRGSWRRVTLAALPLLLVAGWYVKDAVLFHTDSTSSMLGMNLAKVTLLAAPQSEVQHLVAEGRLSSLALVAPFQSVRAYVPAYAPPASSGVRILAEVQKRDRVGPNLNNLADIAVSAAYLRADLSYIADEPRGYLENVTKGIRLWFVPTEQYAFLDPNVSRISGYVRFFDRYLLAQPDPWSGSGNTPPVPSGDELSYGAVLIGVLSLFGLPVLIIDRRRERVLRAASAVVWVTIAYAFIVTSLVEYGENNRFRFDIGPLPLLGALVVCFGLIGPGLHPNREPRRPVSADARALD